MARSRSLFGLSLILLISCGIIPSEVEVELDYPIIVRGGLSTVEPEPLRGAGNEMRQSLSNEGVPMNLVESVRLAKVDLLIITPTDSQCSIPRVGCDLSFIGSLELFVEAREMDPLRIAHIESLEAVRAATLEIDDVDLAPFLRAEDMSLVAVLRPRQSPIQDVLLELRSTLTVTVGRNN